MIRYRPFRNSDPPALVDIWCAQAPERGLAQPMSVDVFEHHVLGKPYFENDGLIVAIDGDDRPVGFAHAGFGPAEKENALDTRWGVTCMLLVRASHRGRGIGRELLARSEAYLRARGAEVLYAGGIKPLNPFYLGMYGGSELPGVLATDEPTNFAIRSAGYAEIDRVIVLARELANIRAPVDRQQMQVRRRSSVDETIDPAPDTWWDACTLGGFDLVRYDLAVRDAPQRAASALFWTAGPIPAGWGAHVAGLLDLEVDDPERRQGYATFLLSEAFRRLQAQGVAVVKAQTMQHNSAARALYLKLGFQETDQGVVYRKQSA